MTRDKSRGEIRYKLTCSKCGWFFTEKKKEMFKEEECMNCGNKYNYSRDIKTIEE